MAGFEPRPNDATIYKERDKKNEKGPDWKGSALVVIPEGARPGDVVKMDLAFWAKGQYGTMLAGNIKPTRSRDDGFPAKRDDGFSGGGGFRDNQDKGRGDFGAASHYDLNDDIPF